MPYCNALSNDQWAALNSSVTGQPYSDLLFSKPYFSQLEDPDIVIDDRACATMHKKYFESECQHV